MPEVSIEQINHKFNRIRTLPPLPRTAAQLLVMIGDPEVEIDKIARIIEQDPALAARILGLANSAYFGQTQAITQVRQAIIRVLGINLVKSLALSISLAGAFDTSTCRAFSISDYWYTALGSATVARMVVHGSPLIENGIVDLVYLIALVHNLGLLLLANTFPSEMSAALETFNGDAGQNLLQLEQDAVGIDHISAGEWLLRRWHLPDVVIDVVGHLDDSKYEGGHHAEWLCVRWAVDFVATEMAGGVTPPVMDDNLVQALALDESIQADITQQFLTQAEGLHLLAHSMG